MPAVTQYGATASTLSNIYLLLTALVVRYRWDTCGQNIETWRRTKKYTSPPRE